MKVPKYISTYIMLFHSIKQYLVSVNQLLPILFRIKLNCFYVKPGFHMIATIAVIAAIAEKKNTFSDRSHHSDHMETSFQGSQRQRSLRQNFFYLSSAIAGKWFPYDRQPEIHPIDSSRFLLSTTSESIGRGHSLPENLVVILIG